MNWKDASVGRVICSCRNVTKKEIIAAIQSGARSLDDIRKHTGACLDTHENNPRCMDCRLDAAEMLAYYSALADALKR
ncbi:MAG: (2Fe-2S)-binding protein [Synergistaceae bacterium]|nr:(2Fe-2S)-binding protein [Synergistaceae bacterium]